MEKKGKTFTPSTKFSEKIKEVYKYMEEEDLANDKQLKNIKVVANNQNNLLSIQNFHRYVHSYKTQSASSDLKLKWDNLEEFFEILWKPLKK